MLRCIKGIELTECSEIVESDHRGYLTDVDFAEYFAEELVEGDLRKKRCLNPNRKTHREIFVKKCEELLDVFNIENELNEVNEQFDGAKIEQIDKDITCIMRNARKKVEGPMKGLERSNQKRKLRAMVSYWKMIVRQKEGKFVSRGMIQKRKDMADMNNQQDITKNEAEVELRVAKEKWTKHVEKMKKLREEELLDMQDNEFDDDDEKAMKKKDKMLKSMKKH